MEKIGIKKDIDKLGRICIPKELRELYGLISAKGEGEAVEVELLPTIEGILIRSPKYRLVKKSEASQ